MLSALAGAVDSGDKFVHAERHFCAESQVMMVKYGNVVSAIQPKRSQRRGSLTARLPADQATW